VALLDDGGGRMNLNQRIVIDGNDGTGKSTLAHTLRCLGFTNVLDRGEMSRATLDPMVGPAPDTVYILLVCDWKESKRRLLQAGKDMTEIWHTDEALQRFDADFRRLAPVFNAKVISSVQRDDTVLDVVTHLGAQIRLGAPSGRLADKARLMWPFDQPPTGRVLTARCGPIQAVWTRTRSYPQMVALGSLDTAVVGSDALEGNPYASQVSVIHRVPQTGRGGVPLRMVIASKTGAIPKTPLLRVVTPFPEWAARVFGDRGIPHTTFSVSGGSEGILASDLGDVLFDVVETGDTLRQNNLHIVEEIATLDTCIITRRNS
jgi:ATP phosphoribosyltransferase